MTIRRRLFADASSRRWVIRVRPLANAIAEGLWRLDTLVDKEQLKAAVESAHMEIRQHRLVAVKKTARDRATPPDFSGGAGSSRARVSVLDRHRRHEDAAASSFKRVGRALCRLAKRSPTRGTVLSTMLPNEVAFRRASPLRQDLRWLHARRIGGVTINWRKECVPSSDHRIREGWRRRMASLLEGISDLTMAS